MSGIAIPKKGIKITRKPISFSLSLFTDGFVASISILVGKFSNPGVSFLCSKNYKNRFVLNDSFFIPKHFYLWT